MKVDNESVDMGDVTSAGQRRPVASTAQTYLEELSRLLASVDLDALDRVVEAIADARDRGAMVFIAGNGGSAATATHWVNDLCKAASRSGRRPIRAMCLSDNVSWLTALGNDEGYDRVFAGQLGNLAEPGDVLVVISASGNSPNLLRAVEYASSIGVRTAALLGFDGGALLPMVDDSVWIETAHGEYGLVESAHSVVADIVTTYLIDDRP
ncbi:MAG TPA: SIS domain-containing protein [Acidimicrobiia bacterium]|nr:SIS domain-containing protein [Acidimicrobiia bacterium]